MEGLAAKEAAMSNMVKHDDWLFERLMHMYLETA